MQMLSELNRAGKTIVMVTHENEIAEWARRVIRLRDGIIESDERHDRLDRGPAQRVLAV